MKNSRENKNVSVNRALFYKKQKELVSSKKQIISKSMNSLQDTSENSELNYSWDKATKGKYQTWSVEKELLNLYLHKRYKSEQVYKQAREQISQIVEDNSAPESILKKAFGIESLSRVSSEKLKSPDFAITKSTDSKNFEQIDKGFSEVHRAKLVQNSVLQDVAFTSDLLQSKRYPSPSVKAIPKDTIKDGKTDDGYLLRNKRSEAEQSKIATSKVAKKHYFTNFLFSYKQIAVDYFKHFSIQPTQLNIILSSIFYFIALYNTLERREDTRYLSILLQGKIPGYTSLYQKGCWGSFESMTSKYLLSKNPSEGLASTKFTKREAVKSNPSKALLPFAITSDLLQSKRYPSPSVKAIPSVIGEDDEAAVGTSAQYKNSVACHINDINLSKDQALISTRTPWNKKGQKDFRAFFIDTVYKKENSRTKKRLSNNVVTSATAKFCDAKPSVEKMYILAPWYNIDACALPSDVVIATRETYAAKTKFLQAGTKDAKSNIFDQKDTFCDRIKGLEYLIPYYNSKEQIFLENDSIPSKCNSLKLTNYARSSESAVEKSKKYSDKYLDAFQHIMNQYFYRDGLLLLNLAETASLNFVVTNTSHGVLPTLPSTYPLQGYINSKVDKKQSSKLITGEENKAIVIQQDIKELLNWDQLESDNSFFEFVNAKSMDFSPTFSEVVTPLAKHSFLPASLSGFAEQSVMVEPAGYLRSGSHKEEVVSNPEDNSKEIAKFTAKRGFISHSLGFKLLFSNSFRANSWNSMRYVSGYKFPDLNAFSVSSLFKQFIIPRVLISSSFYTGGFNLLDYLKENLVKAKPSTKFAPTESENFAPTKLVQASTEAVSLRKAKPESLRGFYPMGDLGKASQLVNQVLLTPFRLNIPPALPTCYFKNLILSTHSFATQKSKTADFTIKQSLKAKQEDKDTEKFELLYKRITLPEFTQITKAFDKVGIDYQDYLKQPKDSPFALLISPSLEDDDAIRLEAERKAEQGEKKMTPFQLLQDIRDTEKQLEDAKDLRLFSAKNVLAYQSVNGTSDLTDSKIFRLLPSKRTKFDTQTAFNPPLSFAAAKFSEFFKASFFGEMSLLPKLLVAKDQKEIKEQLLATNPAKRLPNLRLRAEKDVIDLLDPANLEVRNAVGTQHRTFKADVSSSLKASAGDITKFCYSGGHKRKIISNLFVAPSQHHVTLPQISSRDWKKILEWQLKTYFFDEQKRLESLRENNPEKQFKMKKLTIYLPWVTFRTTLNNAFEWPLTRLDFTEFVPARLSNSPLLFSNRSDFLPDVRFASKTSCQKKNAFGKNKTEGFAQAVIFCAAKCETGQKQVDYLIAAKNMTLSYNYSGRNALKSDTKRKLSQQTNVPEKLYQNKKVQQGSKREKVINKQYLFQGVTNQSYLLIYRLFLLFVLKSVFQYVYRISLRQFLIKMAYSDFGLTVTSPEFREWLQNSTPKAVYKVHKPLQSIAGIEHNISTISQIIWHLRNFGRTRHNIPAVLLLGPTAAEKTSLVQAIASEAKVAVVVQPLDTLLSNTISPYEKLEEVFLLARKQAPCILFLDSLDQIGKSRKNVVSNYAGAEDSLFCLDADIAEGKHDFANLTHSLETGLLVNKSDVSTSTFDRFCFHIRGGHSRGGGYSDDALSDLSVLDQQDANQNKDIGSTSPLAFYQEKTEFESLRINLLLRLLTEIDGISPLQGVIVMATSNQSAMLDPALLRPGRFQTIIKLSLPDKDTRIQLLKIESQRLGSSHSIPWEYLATRTSNMSGADILSVINHSAIRAILDNTVHTVQSLEHGLNCALGLPKSKNFALFNSKSCNDPFHTSRLAFYQAGKVVVQNLLLEYPNDAFFSLESTLLDIEQKNSNVRLDAIQQDFKLVCPSPPLFITSDLLLRKRYPKDTIEDGKIGEEEKAEKVLDVSVGKKKTRKRVAAGAKAEDSLQRKMYPKDITVGDNTAQKLSTFDTNSFSKGSEGYTFFATTRLQFQTRLVALYAGKAAELLQLTSTNALAKNVSYIDLFLNHRDSHLKSSYKGGLGVKTSNTLISYHRSSAKPNDICSLEKTGIKVTGVKAQFHAKNWQSNLAFSDLLTASSVIHAMIDRWYLYSQKLFTFKSNQVFASLNYEQMQEQHHFVLFHKLTKQVYSERAKVGFWSNSKDQNNSTGGTQQSSINQIIGTSEFSASKQIRQERQKISWWNEKICQEVEMFERPYGKWYRLYLPKVEQRERNEEWVPPDFIFHDFSPLSNLSKDHSTYLKTLHDLYLFERDSAYYNVVMNCFYKAFNLLSENRELVDFLADHFIRFKILRSPEMSTICSLYLR